MKSKNVIEAIFKRNCTKHFNSMLWAEVPDEIKNIVQKNILTLAENDVIMLYFLDETYFWLLTSCSLIVFQEKNSKSFAFSEIKQVRVPKQLFDRTIEKSQLDFLLIYTENCTLKLQVEIKTWPAVLKVLQFVIM